MIISRSIYVAENGIIYSFLLLSSIPLYICTTSLSTEPPGKPPVLNISTIKLEFIYKMLMQFLKIGHIFNIQKTKIMASGPIT